MYNLKTLKMEWNKTLPMPIDFCQRVLVTCINIENQSKPFVTISYINEKGQFCDISDYEIFLDCVVLSWIQLPIDTSLAPF
jgi:hypothetical protein